MRAYKGCARVNAAGSDSPPGTGKASKLHALHRTHPHPFNGESTGMAFRTAGAGMSFAAASAGGLDQTSAAEKAAQQKALDELLGVLLSAGYFRARIPQLIPFDKVSAGRGGRLGEAALLGHRRKCADLRHRAPPGVPCRLWAACAGRSAAPVQLSTSTCFTTRSSASARRCACGQPFGCSAPHPHPLTATTAHLRCCCCCLLYPLFRPVPPCPAPSSPPLPSPPRPAASCARTS